MKSPIVRFTAKVLLIVMAGQLILPATRSFALTTGPSQPEVQSFEPVGTTQMVDLFSGDFTYNIPLMDIEGYPVNIAYHSGANIEQEASWVGLGWNINPGDIGRNVRGVPDDFSGDTLVKKLHIKDENTYSFRAGVEFGLELLGYAPVKLPFGLTVSYNNYRGMGVNLDASTHVSFPGTGAGIGMGVDVGSQSGATIDANVQASYSTDMDMNNATGTLSLSGSTGFNTRSGLRNVALTTSADVFTKIGGSFYDFGGSTTKNIPIGMQNYVSVITNANTLTAGSFQVKLGVELLGTYPNVSGTLSLSTLSYSPDGSRDAYGYLYAQNSNANSIMDFSREKDGIYNSSLQNLPLSSLTYDIYNITGQGTAGMYRPFRNDIGSVFDPTTSASSDNFDLGVEAGVGGLFEAGGDANYYHTKSNSGPWYRKLFKSKSTGSLFENTYFKQGGEMTHSLQQDNAVVSSHNPVMAIQNGNATNFRGNGGSNLGTIPDYYGGTLSNRASRASLLSFLTNAEDTIKAIGSMPQIESYPQNTFINANNSASVVVTKTNRIGTQMNNAKAYHIGEMTQVLPDGRRYVYGIPAMNNLQKEVTFAVANANANINSGLVSFSATDNSIGNQQQTDQYYQATYTPAYAHSYLLTQVLSADYTDVTGDGLSEDDLGSYTKFNYTKMDGDYRWIAPIQAGGFSSGGSDSAQYNPGFWSDTRDDKGNITMGSREEWYMHSIETKNMVAEFYTSKRNDALGTKKAIVKAGDVNTGSFDINIGTDKPTNSNSYKLDSIKLFNKHDRIVNGNNAIPIKTVIFKYDYLLCPGVPNYLAGQDPTMTSSDSLTGKLTLRRIYFRYGNSDKSLMNPYEFSYNGGNKPYNFSAKDRWGNYKGIDPTLTNYEFPYVKQDTADANANVSNWQLTGIKLPSGGNLKIQYESDDYSYVQDKRTMEMFKIAGVGDGPGYNPKTVLYENADKAYNYIYFNRNIAREIPTRSMRANYLETDNLLHFTFDVDLSGKNRFEHINGYAKVDSVGYCNNDPNSPYGFVKVELESAGDSKATPISPVTLAALNLGRYYLPQIIYPGYNNGNTSGGAAVLAGLAGALKELVSITENANLRFIGQSLSKQFKPAKSWIRLNSPGYTKLGGGLRVRNLTLDDGWNAMTSSGTTASYGQHYDYTTLLDNKTVISSGVASYEPMIGADEIPQRQPVKYTADAGRLLPAIQFFQEEPFGESFYPGATVGYSKVTVTSIHKGVGRSSMNKNISEFYTAKDFPIETDFTDKEVPVNSKSYTLLSRSEEVNVQQGYAVIMNDMHGKPKSVSDYVTKSSGGGIETDELITSTKYNYQTQNGKLYNTVKAVKRNQLVRPTYSIANMVLGEEADFSIDNRMKSMSSEKFGVDLNLNVISIGIIPIPITTVMLSATFESTKFKSQVATKIVQQYGVLKSVETSDHGARTIAENELWDSETGQVILTTVNNEYNDPVNKMVLPAYWAYDNMGPACFNTGYEEVLDSVYIDPSGNGYLLNLVDKRQLNLGDELLIKLNNNNYKVWITGMASPPALPTVLTTMNGSFCDTSFVPMFQPRAIYPSGDGVTPWIATTQGYRNVYFKVIRAGRRNQLNATIAQTSFLGSGLYTPSSFTNLLTDVPSRVISSSANNYTDTAADVDFTTAAAYGFNRYVKGLQGNFRDYQSFAWVTPRAYGHHARTNGYDSTYMNPFFTYTDSLPCSLSDVVLWPAATWNALKTVTKYSPYGEALEEFNNAGIRSAALYGFNHALPVAVGSNIAANRLRYIGFEDLLEVQQRNRDILGIYEILNRTVISTTQKFHNGLTYDIPSATDYGTNTSVTSAYSHTGNYSMLFTGAGKIKLGSVTDFKEGISTNPAIPAAASVPYCYVSMWVRPTVAGTPPTGSMFIEGKGQGTNTAPSQDFTAFTVMTHSIDGWYKLEGKIAMSLLSSYNDIYLSMPANFYVDDIRLYPDDGNMKSFAYDVLTQRLMAELDENNFATFYEYDQEGVLVRVKKESDRGILTVSENRKSNAKSNF